jgi:transcriptional regulator
MYARDEWRETDRARLLAAIGEIRLGALVVGPRLDAVHAPFLARERAAAEGGGLILEAHLARGNPVWRAAGDGAPAIVLFQGPAAYVRPSWYPAKKETGKVVPTWLYVAVHVRGTVRAVHDPAWLRDHVARLSAAQEAGRPEPWSVEDAPEDYLAAMIRGVVGIEIEAASVEGVWKLNQHHAAAARAGAEAGLAASAAPGDRAVAAAMAALREAAPR